MKRILLLALLYFPSFVILGNTLGDTIAITKIWDQAKHNGFPDLCYFNNEFYCVFREGPNHVDNTNSGKVRIIKSSVNKSWQTVAFFEIPGMDVREARLSITPDGRIMVIAAAGIWQKSGYLNLAPYASFSDKKGSNFSNLEKVTMDEGIASSVDWIWRVTWYKGVGYGIIYQVKKSATGETQLDASLLRTTNGKHYQKMSQLPIDGNPNESTIRFDKNGKMYILVRRETGDKMGMLAISDFPYKDWNYHKLNFRLGGPNFLLLGKDQLCIGSRWPDKADPKKNVTAVLVTGLQGKVLKALQLPSGGDTGYPGMVLKGKDLWVAYYSSHEGKANIYLARVPLSNLKTN